MQFRSVVTFSQRMHPEGRRRDRRLAQAKSWGKFWIQECDAKPLPSEDQHEPFPTDTQPQYGNIDLTYVGLFHSPGPNTSREEQVPTVVGTLYA